MHYLKPVAVLLLACSFASAAGPQSLAQVRRIYVARMPNNLDQYVRTEIYKQFKDKVSVVLDRREADAVLVEPGPGSSGRAFPLPAMNTVEPRPSGEILVSLLDRSGKLMLWSDSVGSRDEIYKKGGVHTIAEHLVHKLKKAIDSAR